jgi:hypothetical protein
MKNRLAANGKACFKKLRLKVTKQNQSRVPGKNKVDTYGAPNFT